MKTYEELLNNSLNYLKQELEKLNVLTEDGKRQPITIDYNTQNGKVLYALANMFVNGLYNTQKNEEFQMRQFFPQTADMEALKYFHGNTWGVVPRTKTPSSGFIVVNGSQNEVILQGSQLEGFSTNKTETIKKYNIAVKTITVLGTKATLVLSQDFIMASNMKVARIYGANEEGFNVQNATITTISTDSFVYDVPLGTPAKATGEIFVEFVCAQIPVTSIESGSNQNKINGTALKFDVPKLGIDKEAYVSYDGITGGADDDTDDDLREQILQFTSNPRQGWSAINIDFLIRQFQYGKYRDALILIPRAEKINGDQESGYSMIYILKKDLTVLSNTELTEIKKYLKDNFYRCDTTDDRLNVLSPNLKIVNIKLTLEGEANTLAMREAVEETIKQIQQDRETCYFRKRITRKRLEFWLDQVMDSNGNILDDNYVLEEPSIDVEVAYNEFPIIKLEWSK